jgi:hypothetical protein
MAKWHQALTIVTADSLGVIKLALEKRSLYLVDISIA